MTAILVMWFVFIVLEVIRNWHLIEHLKMDVDHVGATFFRLTVFGTYWIVCLFFVDRAIPIESWLFMPVMMAFTFWCIFDVGLNLMRGKSLLYFGEGSWLDRKQSAWPLPWVIFKFFFAGASILTWYKASDLF